MTIDYKQIKFVKNIGKKDDRMSIAYGSEKVGNTFFLWFSEHSKPKKFCIGDIVLLYQRLNGESTVRFTHLVRILDKKLKVNNGGYELEVEVVGTVNVLKSVTSVCDYLNFKGIGQSGRLVPLRHAIKGHASSTKVRKRIIEIFRELGTIA